jgi:hypothetical protein
VGVDGRLEPEADVVHLGDRLVRPGERLIASRFGLGEQDRYVVVRADAGSQLETMRAHLEGDRAVSATARRLFRHRNTVLHHLRRFEELTGLSLSHPHDVATALLAVRTVGRLS